MGSYKLLTKPNFTEKKTIIIIPKKGDKISFVNDNIIVKNTGNKTKFQYTCHKIFLIYIVGGFSLTTGIIEKSKKFGFSICFLTAGFKFYESLNYTIRGNFILVKKQYTFDFSNEIARKIIINKLQNQIKALKQTRDNDIETTINKLEKYILDISKLESKDTSIQKYMGFEGLGAKVYYNKLFNNLEWNGRRPRIKDNIINLLLDIGYTILFNYIDAMLSIYGFDCYKGNLHQEFYNRKSLTCDMIEPFRVIIDLKVRKMYNLKQIKEENFICFRNSYNINYKSDINYAYEFIKEIDSYSICIFEYIRDYYRWFMKFSDFSNFNNFPMASLIKN